MCGCCVNGCEWVEECVDGHFGVVRWSLVGWSVGR